MPEVGSIFCGAEDHVGQVMLAWCFAEHSNVLVRGHWKQTIDVPSDSLVVDV